MEVWLIILIVVLANLGSLWLGTYIILPIVLYNVLLVRSKPEKWTRECSMSEDEEQKFIHSEAYKWRGEHLDKMREIHIENEGFNLYGEYMDFGFDRCVLLIAGRTEGLVYSYYYAEPYLKCGYNVMVIDNRSHGLSDGKYNTLGLKEYKDILAWCKFAHDELNNKEIILHGICIGSTTGLYALISPDCPDYMVGLVAEGMYYSFYESLKNHMKEMAKVSFPYSEETIWLFKQIHKVDPIKYGPGNVIKDLKKPILMLYCKQDKYSTPSDAQKIFDSCGSEIKQLTWFELGAHSRVRLNNLEKYDATIVEFLNNHFPN